MKPHRLAFISNMAAPYQVRLCAEMNRYLETEFWFHVQLDKNRPAWWRVDLGEKCRVLPYASNVRGRYFAPTLLPRLQAFDPSVVMLGSFAWPSCALGYGWAKMRGRRSVVFTECFRGGSSTLRGGDRATHAVDSFYRGVDAVWTSNQATTSQLKAILPRLAGRVRTSWYPCDLEGHLRIERPTPEAGAVTFLFANRLVDDYDPLRALEIFRLVHARFPRCTLKMNADGPLRADCERLIAGHQLRSSVTFLDGIRGWAALTDVYASADVFLQPARFSNGSIAVVEAMAAGMGTVVSDRVLWNVDIIQHGVNGFLSAPDTERMTALCLEYASRPELISAHGAQARVTARRYDVPATAKAYVDMLKELPEMPDRVWN